MTMTNTYTNLRDLSAEAVREMDRQVPGTAEHDEARCIARKIARAAYRARCDAEIASGVDVEKMNRRHDRARLAERVESAAALGGYRLTYQELDEIRQGRGETLIRRWLA